MTAENLLALPSAPDMDFRRHFDPSLLESTAGSSSANPTLKEFLKTLNSRFSDDDDSVDAGMAAAPPPDVARYPAERDRKAREDMLPVVDHRRPGVKSVRIDDTSTGRRDGVKSERVVEDGGGKGSGKKESEKGGLFASLRRKGKKR